MKILAKIIADSIANGIRLVTMEFCYPRFIHSEVMTHRMFSRNASSSRAIPVERVLEQVKDSPAMPIHWGKNQPGMRADIEYTGCEIPPLESLWRRASEDAHYWASELEGMCIHKQIVNRLLEPFQWIKVIVTATEWGNFFKLRDHADAQPEIAFLAAEMRKAMEESTPVELKPGEWHLPYVTKSSGRIEDDIKCSVARCARVSYNNHDNSSPDIEKDIALADRLLSAGHMSPLEHQATPMQYIWEGDLEWENGDWPKGYTHSDRIGTLWSGNFRGWIQYRQYINN